MEILLGFASSEVSIPDNLLCYRYMSDGKLLEEALTEGKYRVCFSKMDKTNALHEYQCTVHQEEDTKEANISDLHPDNIHVLSLFQDNQNPSLWNHSIACVEYQLKDFFSSLQKNMESPANDIPFYLYIVGDVRTEDKQMNYCNSQYFHSCFSNRFDFMTYCIDCLFTERKESKTSQEYRIMVLDPTPETNIICKPQRYDSKNEASSLSSTFTTTIPHSILN